MTKLEKLNRIQMPTWLWLKMNDTSLEIGTPSNARFKETKFSFPENDIKTERDFEPTYDFNIAPSQKKIRDFVLEHKNYGVKIIVPEGASIEDPICIDFCLDESSPVLFDYIEIIAKPNSKAKFIIRYEKSGEAAVMHAGFVSVKAEKGAEIGISKLQLFGYNDTCLDGCAVDAATEANADVIFCEFGGKDVVSDCNILLEGNSSRGNLDVIYLGDRDRRLDLNYRTELSGKKSEGTITARGALSGNASKTLKCTIDFVKGSSGSKGKEEETVLSLSENAKNLTIPLLLSGEDDVEGSHSTSTGKPAPSKLYYLMSRGMDEQEAKKLLVEASFTPIIEKIPSDELKREIRKKLREVLRNEK